MMIMLGISFLFQRCAGQVVLGISLWFPQCVVSVVDHIYSLCRYRSWLFPALLIMTNKTLMVNMANCMCLYEFCCLSVVVANNSMMNLMRTTIIASIHMAHCQFIVLQNASSLSLVCQIQSNWYHNYT